MSEGVSRETDYRERGSIFDVRAVPMKHAAGSASPQADPTSVMHERLTAKPLLHATFIASGPRERGRRSELCQCRCDALVDAIRYTLYACRVLAVYLRSACVYF
jgi:hypothetical protein